MLPPKPPFDLPRIPERYLRYLRPALGVAISVAAMGAILDALYRPRAVIARSDRRLLLAAVWAARPANDRLRIYRTIDRRGIGNDAFSSGPIALSPDGNMVAVVEHEFGFDFFDVSLEIIGTRLGTSLFFATDVSYPTRVWRASDADAPPFLVAAQAQMTINDPEWTDVLEARFIDDPSNDIGLIDWIAEGVVVGGTAFMQETVWGADDFVPWWRAMGRNATGQLSVVLAQGIGTHPYPPLPDPTPTAVLTTGTGTPTPLLIDGVRQVTPQLAVGVDGATGAW